MLDFHTTTSHLVISGNTFPIKHIIKSVGGNWHALTKTWLAPLAIDGQVFRISLRNCETLAGKNEDMTFWTNQTKKMAMRAVLFKQQEGLLDTDFWWICCEYCTIKDWHRQQATCPCHKRIV